MEAPCALPVYCPGLSLLGSSSVCLLQSTLRGTHELMRAFLPNLNTYLYWSIITLDVLGAGRR